MKNILLIFTFLSTVSVVFPEKSKMKNISGKNINVSVETSSNEGLISITQGLLEDGKEKEFDLVPHHPEYIIIYGFPGKNSFVNYSQQYTWSKTPGGVQLAGKSIIFKPGTFPSSSPLPKMEIS